MGILQDNTKLSWTYKIRQVSQRTEELRTSIQTKSQHSFACGWKFEEPKREDDPVAEQNSSRAIRTELITSATMLITARLIKTLLMNVTVLHHDYYYPSAHRIVAVTRC